MHAHTHAHTHRPTDIQTGTHTHIQRYTGTQVHAIVTYTCIEGLKKVISRMDFSTT